ncbi:dimethylnonatriene synthase [Malania oleifera]|uniref:dimethylnonatriene synthase n=1 Tax=Malania oleifera TaxID=397392 RepID=UPI0025AE8CBA|nr:dimethylnonatriene synthase [Malania oleifera]
MDGVSHFQAIIAILILVALYRFRPQARKKGEKSGFPEPPGALPIIGHLHLLGGPNPIARTLGELTDKYGPAYTLRLGSRPALVISSWEMVKDCFTTNDRFFATRPDMAVARYIGYNRAAFALSPHGAYWRSLRKMATVELLSNSRLESLSHVRDAVVGSYLKYLHALCRRSGDGSATATMSWWLECLMISINIKTVAGLGFTVDAYDKEGGEAWRLRRVLKEVLFLGGTFVPSDSIWWLEWMDFGGHLRAMKRAFKEFDSLLGSWLEEHLQKKKIKKVGSETHSDFMEVMLSNLEEDDTLSSHERDIIVKATALTLILTGTESTSLTVTWALSLLLNSPRELKKAQDEIDAHVGTHRWAQESDTGNLPYLQAIIKEALRLYPPGPLSGPREAVEDCCVGGHFVAKGTRLIVNLWKLQRDPRVWDDACEFRPERFLTKHAGVGVRGQNFEYIPFSSGRRSCPAITYGVQVAHLTLARLIQGFELATPGGAPVDMREGLGIALPKVNPLEVVLKPRLPAELYDQLNSF